MSKTPRTDEEIFKVEFTSGVHEAVDADLARTLELENQQLREELAKWKEGCLVNASNAKDALRKSDEQRLDILQLRAALKECAIVLREYHQSEEVSVSFVAGDKALSNPLTQSVLQSKE